MAVIIQVADNLLQSELFVHRRSNDSRAKLFVHGCLFIYTSLPIFQVPSVTRKFIWLFSVPCHSHNLNLHSHTHTPQTPNTQTVRRFCIPGPAGTLPSCPRACHMHMYSESGIRAESHWSLVHTHKASCDLLGCASRRVRLHDHMYPQILVFIMFACRPLVPPHARCTAVTAP